MADTAWASGIKAMKAVKNVAKQLEELSKSARAPESQLMEEFVAWVDVTFVSPADGSPPNGAYVGTQMPILATAKTGLNGMVDNFKDEAFVEGAVDQELVSKIEAMVLEVDIDLAPGVAPEVKLLMKNGHDPIFIYLRMWHSYAAVLMGLGYLKEDYPDSYLEGDETREQVVEGARKVGSALFSMNSRDLVGPTGWRLEGA